MKIYQSIFFILGFVLICISPFVLSIHEVVENNYKIDFEQIHPVLSFIFVLIVLELIYWGIPKEAYQNFFNEFKGISLTIVSKIVTFLVILMQWLIICFLYDSIRNTTMKQFISATGQLLKISSLTIIIGGSIILFFWMNSLKFKK